MVLRAVVPLGVEISEEDLDMIILASSGAEGWHMLAEGEHVYVFEETKEEKAYETQSAH